MEFDEHNPRFRLLAGLTIMLVVIGGLWAAFTLLWPEDNGQLAILKADNTPYKVRPEQPGGMQIPHQDKLVFNAVSNEGKVVTVERILPPPEQPMVPSQPQNQPGQGGASTPIQPSVIQQAAAMTQEQVKAAQQVPAIKPPQPQPDIQLATEPLPVALGRGGDVPRQPIPSKAVDAPAAFDISKTAQQTKKQPAPEPTAPVEVKKIEPQQAEIKQDEEAKAEEPKEEVKKPSVEDNAKEQDSAEEEVAAPPAGKARFQIASFFDRPSAEKALSQFKNKYADGLNGASLFIAEAKIASGKNVFRIQGAATDVNAINGICSAIKAKGGTCVLAH